MNEPRKIKCIVIDDEDAAIAVLKHFIDQVSYLEYAGGYTSPLEGLQAAQQPGIDILFVDVQMPEINGLELIKHLNNHCKIILTTAYSQYALDGYDLDVTDYLLKPIPLARFLKAIEKAKSQLLLQHPADNKNTANDFILVKGDTKGKFIKIDHQDIDYIEGMKNYAAIVCNGKKIISLLNIKDLEEKLPATQFVRVHKSFIVSIAKISAIQGNQVLLKNSSYNDIVIGDTYRNDFLKIMKSRIIE